MTIQELEQQTGLNRANIRFYEREGLLHPSRRANGYRDYTQADADALGKILCLRTLGLSIGEIRALQEGQTQLKDALAAQKLRLSAQAEELAAARKLCDAMLQSDNLTYATLRPEDFTAQTDAHTQRRLIHLDAVRWIDHLASMRLWWWITGAMLLAALIRLIICPGQIPVQWEADRAVRLADKRFILAYPASAVVIRYLLQPLLRQTLACWLGHASDTLTAYLVNFLCFTALSVEVFTVLYTLGLAANVQALLLETGVVFAGVLVLGIYQLQLNKAT